MNVTDGIHYEMILPQSDNNKEASYLILPLKNLPQKHSY
jgi:hypothetical protein